MTLSVRALVIYVVHSCVLIHTINLFEQQLLETKNLNSVFAVQIYDHIHIVFSYFLS